MMFDVACVGIIVADNVLRTVRKVPDQGKLELVDELQLFSGGCAVNAGIDLAKIGMNVAVIGKVGQDGYGSFLLDEMRKAGVNVDSVVSDGKTTTSSSAVLISENGERSFFHCLGANAEFTEQDVDYSVIENSKIVFVAGTMLMPKFDGEPCAKMLKKAQQCGKITVLDTAWDSTGRWMDVLAPCMPYIDLFIPSLEEAVQLSGESEPEKIADKFLCMGVKTCVIKLGSKGCFIKDSATGFTCTLPTYEKIKPVDSNGAGDSFCAGFLAGLAQGWSLEKSGRFANAVGTHCILSAGASTGIKPMKTILEFMENYNAQE